jgi:hypothetical protein
LTFHLLTVGLFRIDFAYLLLVSARVKAVELESAIANEFVQLVHGFLGAVGQRRYNIWYRNIDKFLPSICLSFVQKSTDVSTRLSSN